MPVDQYIGGIEHADPCTSSMRASSSACSQDIDLLPRSLGREPFAHLLNQGMVCMHCPRCKRSHAMSKSHGNVVDPQDMIDKYGADALRLFMLFLGPPQAQFEWKDEGLEAAWRFLGRVWRVVDSLAERLPSLKAPSSESEATHKPARAHGADRFAV